MEVEFVDTASGTWKKDVAFTGKKEQLELISQCAVLCNTAGIQTAGKETKEIGDPLEIEDEKSTGALRTVSYDKAYVPDFLPLVKDYVRTEDMVAQKKIHALLMQVYESLGFPIIEVPVLEPEERVGFIFKNL